MNLLLGTIQVVCQNCNYLIIRQLWLFLKMEIS